MEPANREHAWTLQDIGKNGIAGILKDNNSILKTLENISINPINNSTNIKKVKIYELESYLSSIQAEHDKYLCNRVVGLSAAVEGSADLVNLDSNDTFNSLEEWTARLAMAGSFVANELPPLRSNARSKTSNSNSPKKDISPNKPKMYSGNAPPLHNVPGIYFDEDFSLGNPRVFSTVVEYLDLKSNNSDSFTSQRILQEKLSHYLDIVEIHLMKEISIKSSGFFSALQNLQILQQETKSCIQRISELQEKLKDLSQNQVKKGLEIVKLHRERGNCTLLLESVKIVYKIKQTQPVLQVYLNKGDYVGALDLMEYSGRALNGMQEKQGLASPISLSESTSSESKKLADGVFQYNISHFISQRIDFKGIKSLGNLPLQLVEVSKTIYSVMEADLLNILSNDLSKVVSTPLSVSSASEIGKGKGQEKSFVSPLLAMAPLNFWIEKIFEFNFDPTETQVPLRLPDEKLLNLETELKGKLSPVILGLLRMNKLTEAFNTYKTKLLQDIKILSKKHYPADFYVPDEPSIPVNIKDKQSKLAKQLKAMAFHKFFDLLLMVYVTTLHILQRVSIYHAIISSIIVEGQKQSLPIGLESIKTASKLSPISPAKSSPGKSSPTKSSPIHKHRRKTLEEDDELGEGGLDINNLETNQWAFKVDSNAEGTVYGSFIIDFAGVLASACDLVHVRCAKLIGARSDQHAMLNPSDFYRFFGTTWQFVNSAESITGRICFGLKGAIISQAKAFLNIFHEERSKQIAIMIENEQWVHVEVPVDFQQMIDGIVKSSSRDDGEDEDHRLGLLKKQNSELSMNPTGSSATLASTRKGNNDSFKSGDFLQIAGQNYFVVGFMLLFIKAAHDYLQVAKSVPSLTTDVLHRVFELLKLVNSKSCQMILGAGALKSAGLKNITAKHIAYTSQSLGVIITMIPELKAFFMQLIPPKQHLLLEEFEKLLKDYNDHQTQLHSKLVTIMKERVAFYGTKLLAINWDDPDLKEFSSDPQVSIHMSGLVKETSNLYKVLIKYLPVCIVKQIMTDIFTFYDLKLEEEFKKINFYTSVGKSRLLNEVRYYLENFSNLSHIDGPCNHLEIILNDIKIKDPRIVSNDPLSNPLNISNSGPALSSQASSTTRKPNIFFNMRKP